MKKAEKILVVCIISILVFICLFFTPKMFSIAFNKLKGDVSSDGNWVRDGDLWYYYENGVMITNWKEIDGFWYYLRVREETKDGVTYPVGSMATGWRKYEGDWYYLRVKQEAKDGVTYPVGSMYIGWFKDDNNNWYYLSHVDEFDGVKEGEALRGWAEIDGDRYYFRNGDNDITPGPDSAIILGDNQNPTECYYIGNEQACFDKDGRQYRDTLSNPIVPIYPTQICSVPINASNDSYKMSGVYFFDHYAVYSGLKSDNDNTYLTLVDLNDNCRVLDVNSSYNMGHANDITYNSKTNKFYVVDDNDVYEFQIINNQITNVGKSLTLPNNLSISAFDYDSDNDKYYVYNSKKLYSTNSFDTYNNRIKLADTPTYYDNFIFSANNKIYEPWFIPQGVGYGYGNIYFTRTISDGTSKLNKNYSPDHNSTFIMVYDANTGLYKYTLYFSKAVFDGHAESVTIIGDKIYIGLITYDSNSNEVSNAFISYEGIKEIDDEYTDIDISNLDIRNGVVILNKNSTLDTIFEIIGKTSTQVKVYDGETELNHDTKLKTNNTLKVKSTSYPIGIAGDLVPDGIIDIRDVVKLYDGYTGHGIPDAPPSFDRFTNAEYEAIDINNDSRKNSQDLIIIYDSIEE